MEVHGGFSSLGVLGGRGRGVGCCFLGTTAHVLQAYPGAQLLQDSTNGNVRVRVLAVGSTGPCLGGVESA